MKNHSQEIKVLNDREKAREKLPIWYGSRGLQGSLHAVREVLANSVDEIINNFSSGVIDVNLSADGRQLSVRDSGRGIPMTGETDGKKNYELLFLTLFAGTNYDNIESGKITTGQNGLGLSILCMTSEYFKTTSAVNGVAHTFETKDGGLSCEFKKIGKVDWNGTEVVFKLDTDMYETAVFSPELIEEIIVNQAAMCPNIKFYFNEKEIHFSCLSEYAKMFYKDMIGNSIEGRGQSIELHLSTTIDGEGRTFLNRNWLPENGTIADGVVNGTKLFFNRYLRENVKGSSPLVNADVEQVLSFICHITTSDPEFSGQTKLSTVSPKYKNEAQAFTQQVLETELAKNPLNIKKMSEALQEAQKLNSKNSAARAKLTKVLTSKIDSTTNRIEGLVDCKFPGREDSEIFFTEGLSAAGSIIAARNPHTQASFALRGKPKNVRELSAEKAFENVEVMNIAKILGCGIETKHKEFGEFDINKLRYGKVIIATDSDVDGMSAIAPLFINIIAKFMPEIILQGRLYIALPPLYEIEYSDKTVAYAITEEEKNILLGAKKVSKVSRNKGLGETDASVLAKTTVSPETRNIMKFSASSRKELDTICKKWFGNDVELRRADVMENFKEVAE